MHLSPSAALHPVLQVLPFSPPGRAHIFPSRLFLKTHCTRLNFHLAFGCHKNVVGSSHPEVVMHADFLLAFFFLFFFTVSIFFPELKHAFWLQQLCSADKRRCWTKPLIWTLDSTPHFSHSWLLSWLELTPSWWPNPNALPFNELEVSTWASWSLSEGSRLVPLRQMQDLGLQLCNKPKRRKLSFWRWPRVDLLSLVFFGTEGQVTPAVQVQAVPDEE